MKLEFAKTVAALAVAGLTSVACGGSTPEAAAPEAPAESAEAAEAAAGARLADDQGRSRFRRRAGIARALACWHSGETDVRAEL